MPLFLSDHIARLRHDAAALSLLPPDANTVAETLRSGLQRNAMREGVIRIVVTAPDDRHADTKSDHSTLQILFEPPRNAPQSVDWLLTKLPPGTDRSIKSLQRDHWETARRVAQNLGCFDVLATADGRLLETSICNLFVAHGERIQTPPADGSILPGIGRARLLAEMTLPIAEQALSLEDLVGAIALFGVNSVRGVLPVRTIFGTDGSKIWRSAAIGEVVLDRLRRGWDLLAEREIARSGKALGDLCP